MITRRGIVGIGAAVGVAAVAVRHAGAQRAAGRELAIDARPAAIAIDTARTAVIVVDMQNDFGSKSGMFNQRASISQAFKRLLHLPRAFSRSPAMRVST